MSNFADDRSVIDGNQRIIGKIDGPKGEVWIPPWVRVASLGSKLLSMAARVLPAHWEGRYGYRPMLFETFVERERFTGTCYRAANWTCVGETQGRGKLGDHRLGQVPIKTVWVYPLAKDFRERLSR